ncbi:unnamed protein product [Effrenium voratum]|uniref:Uncharacterized protein n=1 Tax=Effrenium voratum TaxID=2562239 RepID=A0AA36J4P5_9DINO|nr:unnamed protein product [Effrenium voratum]
MLVARPAANRLSDKGWEFPMTRREKMHRVVQLFQVELETKDAELEELRETTSLSSIEDGEQRGKGGETGGLRRVSKLVAPRRLRCGAAPEALQRGCGRRQCRAARQEGRWLSDSE